MMVYEVGVAINTYLPYDMKVFMAVTLIENLVTWYTIAFIRLHYVRFVFEVFLP